MKKRIRQLCEFFTKLRIFVTDLAGERLRTWIEDVKDHNSQEEGSDERGFLLDVRITRAV